MEMHTIDSLRRVHGVNVREARTFTYAKKYTAAGYCKAARDARHAYFIQVTSAGVKAVADAIATRLIMPIQREIRSRRAIRHMMQMSDHQLNDIGVCRGDIEYVARHGKPERQ